MFSIFSITFLRHPSVQGLSPLLSTNLPWSFRWHSYKFLSYLCWLIFIQIKSPLSETFGIGKDLFLSKSEFTTTCTKDFVTAGSMAMHKKWNAVDALFSRSWLWNQVTAHQVNL